MSRKMNPETVEVFFNDEEKEETLHFLRSFYGYSIGNKKGGESTRLCYILKILKDLEEKNILINDYIIFKYYTKYSLNTDTCVENLDSKLKKCEVGYKFTELHKSMRDFFVTYNKNHLYELVFHGYYPKVCKKKSIVEKKVIVLFGEKEQSGKAKKESIIDYKTISQILKTISLVICLFFPMNNTIRRFSSIELVISSLFLFLIANLFAYNYLNYELNIRMANIDVFCNSDNLSIANFAKQGKDLLIDIEESIKKFISFENLITEIFSTLLSVFLIFIFYKYLKKRHAGRLSVAELFFVYINSISLFILLFSVSVFPSFLIRPLFGVITICIIMIYIFYYPVKSVRNLLDKSLIKALMILVSFFILIRIVRFAVNYIIGII